MRRFRTSVLVLVSLTLVACGGDGTQPVVDDLIGTWHLVSVNGVDAPPGTLVWTISATTIIADSGADDCVETGTYTVSGNRIVATTTNLSGSGCGGEVGETYEFVFEVQGDTLTAIFTDTDLGTARFVFRRG